MGNLKELGSREIVLLRDLLSAYVDNLDILEGDEINFGFNENTGHVYLFDEYGDVAMMNENEIERYYSLKNGTEGFAEDLIEQWDSIDEEEKKEALDCIRNSLDSIYGKKYVSIKKFIEEKEV